MGRILEYIKKMLSDIKVTFIRFTLVPVLLAATAVFVSMLIENVSNDDLLRILERLVFSAIAGAFFGTALEFLCERFSRLKPYHIYLQIITLAFSVLYYFLLTSPDGGGLKTVIHLIVICFALFAFYLWIPSHKNTAVFSNNALSHFKACFISMLYSLVLALGLIAIYFAVDLLLVKLDNNIPGHIINIMGIFFFPIYYLALLPDFNSGEEKMLEKCKTSSTYPKFLEVLVSYIAIPLITIFTGVLVIYLLKILFTLKWPIGQLGPMILCYSAVGLFLYVLCGKLYNHFALLYRRLFPVALIPLVCLQLFSVFIRINAFGITESRYYLVLFGVYSIVCAAALILMKGMKLGIIAILAAIFAIISIIPPVDAFTVSRASQTHRVETILIQNNMLSSGKITSNTDVPIKDRIELTNIMNYMYQMGHTAGIEWLPADYNQYQDFQRVFGFGEAYGGMNDEFPEIDYYSGILEDKVPMDISGYNVALKAGIYRYGEIVNETAFELGGKAYKLSIVNLADEDVEFSIIDPSGIKAASLTLKAHLERLVAEGKLSQKALTSPADLTIDADGGNIKMRVIFQNISFQKERDEGVREINGDALVLIGWK